MILNLFGSKKITLKKARGEKAKDKARVVELDVFLAHRMKNRIKKIFGRNWDIVTEDENWLYYGYILGSKPEKLFVKELLKVRIKEVKLHFPSYRTLDGKNVWKIIGTELSKLRPESKHTMVQDYSKYSVRAGDSTQLIFDVLWKYSVDGADEVTKELEITISTKDSSEIKVNILN